MNAADERATETESKKPARSTSKRVAKIILATGISILFIAAVLFAGTVIVWTMMAAVLLGSGPTGKVIPLLLVFLALAAGLSWLMVRYVASLRKVALVIGSIMVLLLVIGTTGAISSPDRALFLARGISWGDSDVWDYQKFPERVVDNAPPVYNFSQNPYPQLFQTIEYTHDGEARQLSLEEFLKSTQTTSFIVIKDDAILYEGYFNGYERDSIVTSFSVAKSITSALIGIAIDEGYIGGVDDLMVSYLPEMRGRGMDEMTIRDLLLMSSGIRFVHQSEKSGFEQAWPLQDESLSYQYPDLRSIALKLPPSDEPVGAVFNYNQYHPILLGMILERTTHQSVSEYSEEKIWKPLGMEFSASWSLDSDEAGFEKMESGFNARAIDFAKFGRLFLNEGDWNGNRIISADWVRESTAPDPNDDRPWRSDQDWKEADGYYKYMWWGRPRSGGDYIYFARGHLGQFIVVSPRDRAIVVRFGIDDGGVDSWDDVCQQVISKIGEASPSI